jgi:hypothetical protein
VTTIAQRVADIKIAPYTFVRNKGQKSKLGRIYVPERHAKPNVKLIELAFVRFKSTAHTPIVYLAGGPGGSGIALAKGVRFSSHRQDGSAALLSRAIKNLCGLLATARR